MKRFLVLTVALMLVASFANAQAPFLFEGENEMGMFMVPNPTADDAQDMACYMGSPGQFTAYIVLTNPVNQNLGTAMENVGGFEFQLGYPAGLFVTPVLHPSATNFMSPPDFFCGSNIPVVGGQCTLITLTIGTFTADPAQWFMVPVSDAAVQSIPGSIAITDANDNFSLSEAYNTTGSVNDVWTIPIFGMFECGQVVPNEDVSWGSVKTLFQ